MKIKFNRPINNDGKTNYGDCITITNGTDLVVYDCGSNELADIVIQQMKELRINKCKVVISHTDSDHIDGVYKLINNNLVESITTFIPLNHIDDIYNKLNEPKIKIETLINRLNTTFENINRLPKELLLDATTNKEIITNVKIIGPSYDYIIDNISGCVDSYESDTTDNTTRINATSVLLEIEDNNNRLLLTGDGTYEGMKNILNTYNHIQLPHHGNSEMAMEIFNHMQEDEDVHYYISDNTGCSNGGSDGRSYKGHNVKNTKNEDISLELSKSSINIVGCYGINNEMHSIK